MSIFGFNFCCLQPSLASHTCFASRCLLDFRMNPLSSNKDEGRAVSSCLKISSSLDMSPPATWRRRWKSSCGSTLTRSPPILTAGLVLMVTAPSFFLKLTADTGWPFIDWRIRFPISLALPTLADVSDVWPVGCLLSK